MKRLAVILGVIAVCLFYQYALAEMTTTKSGLKLEDTKLGEGAEAVAGKSVTVHYTGWLYENGVKGRKFDSSVDKDRPLMFALGKGRVIAGWDEGVKGMKVGGKRTLIIPPKLGYGESGYPPVIPANATLLFEVELKGVE